jgi:hypothetical protein
MGPVWDDLGRCEFTQECESGGRKLSPRQVTTAVMVAEARQRWLELTGPNGLLKLFTKNAPETAANEELTEHLGHEKHHAERSASPPTSVTAPGSERGGDRGAARSGIDV